MRFIYKMPKRIGHFILDGKGVRSTNSLKYVFLYKKTVCQGPGRKTRLWPCLRRGAGKGKTNEKTQQKTADVSLFKVIFGPMAPH